ncbi:twin-arginine translocase subunit TatC [Saccharopolyspora sp. 6V]|uniref:twin-arginine translocase subunit TatC n=1 Tax=unclassified Saccharopolyspora TaxID=2646250 RepID=UPI0035A97364
MARTPRHPNHGRGPRRRWGRRHNPDGTMTLVDHLRELRYRLGVAMIAVVFGGTFGFWWFSHPLFGAPSLGDLLLAPYCSLPPEMRFSPEPGRCRLLQTKPFEVFVLQLKVGIAVGTVLLSPVWLYQLWAFITPGLKEGERKFAAQFVGFATVLFAAGGLLAYFVVPEGLLFMVGFGGDAFFTALTGDEYVGFVLLMLFMFGLSFELPLVLVMLNRAGILSYAKLRSWWRGIVFGLFVVAAVATPGQDPISMLALAAALCALFAVALVLCRHHDRSRARRPGAAPSPDEPSAIDHRPTEPDRLARFAEEGSWRG